MDDLYNVIPSTIINAGSIQGLKFDTMKDGLRTLLLPYQVILIEYIWKLNEKEKTGVTSAQAHKHLSKLPENKSRASVINSLEDMAKEGFLDYEEETCKGGRRRIYYPAMDRYEFAEYVYHEITDKLEEIFSNVQ